MICSNFYNVYAKRNLAAISEILSLGHEIGLHFDETKYSLKNDRDAFVSNVEEEMYVLGRLLGTTIKCVSMHRPSKFTLDSDFVFAGAVNSYSKEFFNNFKYMSDSRMNWREDVFSIVESGEHEKLHILTHPFWYSSDTETARDKLMTFINKAQIQRYMNISENFRDIQEFIRLEELQ